MSHNTHDRILAVVNLAADVFEDREVAISWMNRPNAALEGHTPSALCDTELGERQVRQVLHALEWGGVV
ncbi:MbcA/ParS/Xre antitoxin family protein [Halomonas daqiaonensis]|uniref:Putative toxin-antitoxin system antitoxin component, TIGR02293 family n=1 Tax=Halomonas daqiaonensis TaxID=650850 RepID=A0A1H7KL39_9GAMM|nr:MbcA/ParS/Xre antitoxin family protein [Halomonas daqiaonensis]SEK86705.1 putative toxin-antitoxin system antitoxin component, TIGR02293 family [Halomonas daqiaonensis]